MNKIKYNYKVCSLCGLYSKKFINYNDVLIIINNKESIYYLGIIVDIDDEYIIN